jgi:hypothetical protein
VTCGENGIETAHFKRPPLDGEPVAELRINIDPPNLETLELAWDAERPVSATAAQLDLNAKVDIDGAVAQSPLAPLGALNLAAIVQGTRTLHLTTAVDDAGDLTARSEAALIDAGFFIRAHGTTSTHALGKVLRAHTLVSLAGAGTRHSGNYFCAGVRHFIDATVHRMDVELLRNAWGA